MKRLLCRTAAAFAALFLYTQGSAGSGPVLTAQPEHGRTQHPTSACRLPAATPTPGTGSPTAAAVLPDLADLPNVYDWPSIARDAEGTSWNPAQPRDTASLLWHIHDTASTITSWDGTPVAAGGCVVYAESDCGMVYCRNLCDGTLRWLYPVQSDGRMPGTPLIFPNSEGRLCAALPHYAPVSTTYDTCLMSCWDLLTGELLWRSELPHPQTGRPVWLERGRPIYVPRVHMIYFTLCDRGLPPPQTTYILAVSPDSGSVSLLAEPGNGTYASMTSDGTYLYYSMCAAFEEIGQVLKFDLSTGALVDWTDRSIYRVRSQPALTPDSFLVVGDGVYNDSAARICCYDTRNLRAGPVWCESMTGGLDIQAMAIDKRNCYYCTQHPLLRLYALQLSDGSPAWPDSGPCITFPADSALYDGGIAVVGSDEAGGNRWLYLTPGYYSSNGNRGYIWVVDALTGATIQLTGLGQHSVYTGICHPKGYVLAKGTWGGIYCWATNDTGPSGAGELGPRPSQAQHLSLRAAAVSRGLVRIHYTAATGSWLGVTVMDVAGRVTQNLRVPSPGQTGSVDLDLRSQSSGAYVVRIADGCRYATCRVTRLD